MNHFKFRHKSTERTIAYNKKLKILENYYYCRTHGCGIIVDIIYLEDGKSSRKNRLKFVIK